MRDNRRSRRPRAVAGMAVVLLIWALGAASPVAKTVPYKPKNGVLNWKAVIFGGAFRVTTAIPLHGDFAKYGQVEIARPTSLIGKDVPRSVLDRLGRALVAEFRKGGRFSHVAIVDAVTLPSYQPVPPGHVPAAESFRQADPLNAPLRSRQDMVTLDEARQAAAASAHATDRTLVVRCQVLDYAKGNKLLQFLFLDLGNSILTLRFSYYDLDTGEELGRSVISSDNSSAVVPSAFSARTALTGVVEGLVDQVTRRKIAGER